MEELKKEFYKKFWNKAVVHTDADVEQMYSWITENFEPKSRPLEAGVIKKNAEGLLPCPFCGETEIRLWRDDSYMIIKCGNSECGASMDEFVFKSTAIDTWNKRK